jgi:hypothetical protein
VTHSVTQIALRCDAPGRRPVGWSPCLSAQRVAAAVTERGVVGVEETGPRALAAPQFHRLAIRAEAARRRVQRAERERQRYESENADELLRELAPQASAAREQLSHAAAGLVAANDQWHDVLQAATTIVAASPNGNPPARPAE